MDWITDHIAIGNYLDVRDKELIAKEKFASVLSLDGSLLGVKPENLGVRKIESKKLEDNSGNSREDFLGAVRTLQKLVFDVPPVLVQCHAGKSRSVIVVAGFFMSSSGISAKEAIAKVAAKREIGITPGVEKLLSFIK
jgi:hypothetical protein